MRSMKKHEGQVYIQHTVKNADATPLCSQTTTCSLTVGEMTGERFNLTTNI